MPALFPTFSTLAAELGDSIGRTMQKVLESIRAQTVRTVGTALASAARTVTTLSSNVSLRNEKAVLVHLNVSAASGTGGLTLRLVAVDPVTGASSGYATLTGTITTVGHRTLAVGIGAGAATGAAVVSSGGVGLPCPTTWAVQVIHADASSYTYSVCYELIP
jgi:hypothetical protein